MPAVRECQYSKVWRRDRELSGVFTSANASSLAAEVHQASMSALMRLEAQELRAWRVFTLVGLQHFVQRFPLVAIRFFGLLPAVGLDLFLSGQAFSGEELVTRMLLLAYLCLEPGVVALNGIFETSTGHEA
jgi:hypothetical protein